MKKRLNVFFAIGPKFIEYFTVAVTSLLETNKDLDIHIFLIYDFEDLSILNQVISHTKKKYDTQITLIHQDSSVFDKYKVAPHLTKNTYLRLLIADIIPDTIDSGLFLDSDLVVTGSLHQLANIEFPNLDDEKSSESKKYLYAVREIKIETERNSQRITSLGFKIDEYFNAGVMLMSLKNMRLKNVSAELMAIGENYKDVLLHADQDILNIYFANKWTKLDPTFNALHLIWKRPRMPLIIHYAGASKPWHYLNAHPYKSVYVKYQKMVPFGTKKFEDFSYRKMPLKYFRAVRHFLNYFRQLYLGRLNDQY